MGENTSIIQKRIDCVNSFECGRRWLDGVSADHSGSEHTIRNYARSLYDFSAWLKKTPDEIIAERKTDLKSEDEATKRRFEDIVRRYRIYLQRERKVRTQGAMTAIFSFFKYNYAELKSKIPLDDYTSYKPIDIEHIRIADTTASLHTRVVIRFLLDTGMSREDAVEVNYGDVKDEFEKGNQFIHLWVKRRKENIEYETFVGPNFLSVYRQYKAVLERKGVKITDSTPLICGLQGQKYSPQLITTMFAQLSHKLDFTISPHRIRKTFETFMSLQKVHPVVLKYWMGHKVKKSRSDIEARYIIPSTEDQRKAYIEAYETIDLQPKRDTTELQKAQIKVIMESMSPEQRKAYATELTMMYRSAAHRILSDKRIKELLKEKETRPDGGEVQLDEFKQIPEAKLLQYLKDGWTIVQKLSGGDFIVKQ